MIKNFESPLHLQAYISNIIKMSKMLDLNLYDDIKYSSTEVPALAEISMEISDFKQLQHETFQKESLDTKMDFLFFVLTLLNNAGHIYFTPLDIGFSPQGFHLLNFQVKRVNPNHIFIGFVRWAFSSEGKFDKCLHSDEMPSRMPIYLQEIYHSVLVTGQLSL